MRNVCKYMLGILGGILFCKTTVFAAEIIPTNVILVSNAETVVYAEADLASTIILPDLQEGLPIQVTGITDTGFFQVNLGEVFYIPGYGLSEPTAESGVIVPAQTTAPAGVPREIFDVKQNYNEYIVRVIELVNEERQKVGLNSLAHDEQITYAATQRSYEMVQHSYFEHARPDGRSCFTVMKEYGVLYSSAGENIAWGQNTPEYVMSCWMNSPGHKANILKSGFTKIGVGIATDGNGRLYWTQLFTN